MSNSTSKLRCTHIRRSGAQPLLDKPNANQHLNLSHPGPPPTLARRRAVLHPTALSPNFSTTPSYPHKCR